MAIGKELGSFELEANSFTLSKARGNTITTHLNFEGEVAGEIDGRILISMTIASEDGKNGTYETCARYFLKDGGVVDSFTDGDTTSIGDQRWRVAGIGKTSANDSIAVKGEIDLARRSYTGKLFERI